MTISAITGLKPGDLEFIEFEEIADISSFSVVCEVRAKLRDIGNGKGGLLLRSELNPIALGRLLPYVILMDVERDPTDFLCRILGEYHVAEMGGTLKGMRMGELLPHVGQLKKLDDICKNCVEDVAERFFRFAFVNYRGALKYLDAAVFPLVDETGQVVGILGAGKFRNGERATEELEPPSANTTDPAVAVVGGDV